MNKTDNKEAPKAKTLRELVECLHVEGGSAVSAYKLNEAVINKAKEDGRYYADYNGRHYVWFDSSTMKHPTK